jgi:hypothetical protein
MLRCQYVRTTIRLNDELYRQVKIAAARSGRSAGAVIEDAIRASLATGAVAPAEPLPPLPTFGHGGVMPGVDLDDGAATRDLMEEGVPLDARR